MSPALIVLHLAGAVTLLLWAVRMVRTGVERAYGTALERSLKRARASRLRAAGLGAAVAMMLQSSTAVGVLAAGFAASGLMSFATALTMLLGADLGSALMVRILAFDLSWLIPFLLLAGGWMFMKGSGREVRQTGRILVGVALILVALGMIGEATASLRASEVLPAVVGYLSEDYFTSFLIGALFTWFVHSSIASVLLVASMAEQGLLPVGLALALVLGANLGGALIAVGLTRGSAPAARRVPLGNLAFRGTGAVLGLGALWALDLPVGLAGPSPAEQVVMAHVAFNAVILLAGMPLVGLAGAVLTRLLPDQPPARGEGMLAGRTSTLDRSVLHSPRLALASATRELLRMSEVVEVMLRPVMELYETDDRDRLKARVKELRDLDLDVNKAHSEIKLYLVELNRGTMSADEAQRSMILANFAINLEHVGDLVAKNLYKLAVERCEKRLVFSDEGWRELTDLHAQVLTNNQLALNVLVSGDRASARELIREKERMRDLELRSQNRHLRRLQGGAVESVETSEIHLETIRALKQVNSLFAAIAYPILAESGDLLESRLAKSE
ncbi:MAG TPA: Na/Pi cotransporter family protein [Thermohalobaculum sp.]|nr:Na/Pi cotransporter family protein [Thermohalobaculum sp.]